MYIENDKFTWPKPMNWHGSHLNQITVKEEIKNKKIKLLDKIDDLINQGYTYEDILKGIDIHKRLND